MILPQRVTTTLVTPLRAAEEPTVLAHHSYYTTAHAVGSCCGASIGAECGYNPGAVTPQSEMT